MVWLTLLWYSLYRGDLELNLWYFWGVPIQGETHLEDECQPRDSKWIQLDVITLQTTITSFFISIYFYVSIISFIDLFLQIYLLTT